MDALDPRHGEYAGAVQHWLDGERPCADCARAEWRYRKTRKLRHLRGDTPMVPAVGTLRRIQALHAIGWTGPQIATEAGISVHSMRSIAYHDVATVRRETATKISATYERLSTTWPEGHYANRARSIARRRGWHGPGAWYDIDDPDEQPDPGWRPRGKRPAEELVAEWQFLKAAGVSIHTAASQLGVTVAAIEKAIERARKAAA